MKTVHEILVDAKAKLLKDGWIQGGLGRADGSTCLRGAIWYSIHGGYEVAEVSPEERRSAGDLLCRCEVVLGFVERAIRMELPCWNDAPDRTLEDVIARLDKAILETAPKEEVVETNDELSLV